MKAFTLVELIVVITIIAMLGVIAFKKLQEQAREQPVIDNECIYEHRVEIKKAKAECVGIMNRFDCEELIYQDLGCATYPVTYE